jgi:thymidine kinase
MNIKFIYGTMNSGKTCHLINAYDIYKRKGLDPVVIKPAVDTREGEQIGWGTTKSRLMEKTVPCYYYRDIREISKIPFRSLFVDEAQFMPKADVNYITEYVSHRNVPVLAYGLKTSVTGELFEGSAQWLAVATETKEMERLCEMPFCMDKATHHIRYINGLADRSNNQIAIEKGDVTYRSVCLRHWLNR